LNNDQCCSKYFFNEICKPFFGKGDLYLNKKNVLQKNRYFLKRRKLVLLRHIRGYLFFHSQTVWSECLYSLSLSLSLSVTHTQTLTYTLRESRFSRVLGIVVLSCIHKIELILTCNKYFYQNHFFNSSIEVTVLHFTWKISCTKLILLSNQLKQYFLASTIFLLSLIYDLILWITLK